MTIHNSDAVRNAKNNAFAATIGASPIVRFFDGAIPDDEGTALSGNTLLAEGTLPATCFAASAGGVIAKAGAWTLTGQPGAGAGTAATFYRIYASDGTTCHEQGSLTATGGGGDMTIDNNSIAHGQTITIASYSRTAGN